MTEVQKLKDTSSYVRAVWSYASSNRCSQWLAFECLCEHGDIPEVARRQVRDALVDEQIAEGHPGPFVDQWRLP